MTRSRFTLGLALIAGLLSGDLAAQDASRLRIAGLSIGTVAPSLAQQLAQHGFAPQPVSTDPQQTKRDANRAHRIAAFSRQDGHSLRIGLQREGDPIIRSLDYGMSKDLDSYDLIRKHLLGLFGQPTAAHGSETTVRVAIWEIPGTDMNADGLLTTSITLIHDPVEGHTLTVREARVRPSFQRRGTGPTGRVIATE